MASLDERGSAGDVARLEVLELAVEVAGALLDARVEVRHAPECGERLGRAADARRAADERCDILDVVCRGGALGKVLPKRIVEAMEGSIRGAAGAGGVVGASSAHPPGCRDNVVGAACVRGR